MSRRCVHGLKPNKLAIPQLVISSTASQCVINQILGAFWLYMYCSSKWRTWAQITYHGSSLIYFSGLVRTLPVLNFCTKDRRGFLFTCYKRHCCTELVSWEHAACPLSRIKKRPLVGGWLNTSSVVISIGATASVRYREVVRSWEGHFMGGSTVTAAAQLTYVLSVALAFLRKHTHFSFPFLFYLSISLIPLSGSTRHDQYGIWVGWRYTIHS